MGDTSGVTPIQNSTQERDLGVIFDNELKFNELKQKSRIVSHKPTDIIKTTIMQRSKSMNSNPILRIACERSKRILKTGNIRRHSFNETISYQRQPHRRSSSTSYPHLMPLTNNDIKLSKESITE